MYTSVPPSLKLKLISQTREARRFGGAVGTRQDKARQDTRQEKARQDKARQDKTRQHKARQDKTRQSKTRQDKTSQPGKKIRCVRNCVERAYMRV